MVQRLRLHLLMHGVWVRFLVGEMRPHMPQGQTKIPKTKQKQYYNKFNKDFKNDPHQKKKNIKINGLFVWVLSPSSASLSLPCCRRAITVTSGQRRPLPDGITELKDVSLEQLPITHGHLPETEADAGRPDGHTERAGALTASLVSLGHFIQILPLDHLVTLAGQFLFSLEGEGFCHLQPKLLRQMHAHEHF